uniref:NAD(P)H-quinone oxidoreductase subunit 5, chloroplastic n=2 Tax=Dryopteridaceae TaxID=29607 RepID=A0A7D5F0A1_DRYCA|nr:NADH-plastoquinone oxidoreductase subunit 5 [Dryopteris crassirhizoma]YP_010310977.1 NADH-plastoquinone oxidoreductase subunit 5 [Bolbitis laxireticulata]QLD21407.1 NADH-plastoquinone oxidoreductase subunit 5 [Dryopteris crassirhizoma]UNA61909.1 NADH-plastoquinone oxidoreductase subunit 5 [Bolbitis laxireticulata]
MPVELSNKYACLIPLCPLVASCLTGFLSFFFPKATRSLRRPCAAVNTFSLAIAMFVSFSLFWKQATTHSIQQYLWARIPKSDFHLKIGLLIDPLTLVMAILVTTVGISVTVHSDSYMCHDQGYARLYAYLSLFAASMLGLVSSPNLIQIYVFWELVGMRPYLLIGFRFARSSAANACQKAFVTNRIGDFGLLLGISGIYRITGSFEISELCDRFLELSSNGVVNPIFANTIAFSSFLGPVAKSAQFPLHVWLPDATEGPTPISALIHAATMVAAGIFLIVRIFNFISILPATMYAISWVGGVTTLSGATSALAQKDLKRCLAYSTMSQLGYMVPASGIGASQSALFHLITHAYSKASSFLGSGSVIHSMEEVVGYSPTRSQNMFLMGGLRKHMPITGITSLLGTLSLCGIPPLSCFWSKDQTITESWLCSPYLGLIASTTAGLTAFYTSRIYLLTFEGNFRANQINYIDFDTFFPSEIIITSWGGAQSESFTKQTRNNVTSATDMERNEVTETTNSSTAHPPEEDPICEEAIQTFSAQNLLHPRESNFCMVLPLIISAIPTVFAGLVGVYPTREGAGMDLPFDWLISLPSLFEINKHFENLTEILISSTPSLILSTIGFSISCKAYGQVDKFVDTKIYEKFKSRNLLNTFLFSIRNWSTSRGYIDYYYNIYFTRGVILISKLVLHFDQWIIDGFINGTGTSNLFSGEGIRHGKNGRISQYLFGLIIGTISLTQLVVDFPIPPLP